MSVHYLQSCQIYKWSWWHSECHQDKGKPPRCLQFSAVSLRMLQWRMAMFSEKKSRKKNLLNIIPLLHFWLPQWSLPKKQVKNDTYMIRNKRMFNWKGRILFTLTLFKKMYFLPKLLYFQGFRSIFMSNGLFLKHSSYSWPPPWPSPPDHPYPPLPNTYTSQNS